MVVFVRRFMAGIVFQTGRNTNSASARTDLLHRRRVTIRMSPIFSCKALIQSRFHPAARERRSAADSPRRSAGRRCPPCSPTLL
jgi:hypothetical protein